MAAERSSLKLLTTEKLQSLVEENVVNRVEVEKTRIIKKIEKREVKPVIQENDQPLYRVHPDSKESVHRQSCGCDFCDSGNCHPDANDAQSWRKKLDK